MDDQYDEALNFNYRFKVETNMGRDGVIDHRDGFAQREYKRGESGVYMPPEGSGLPAVNRGERKKIKPSTPSKTKTNTAARSDAPDDAALKAANTKDLKTRNLK